MKETLNGERLPLWQIAVHKRGVGLALSGMLCLLALVALAVAGRAPVARADPIVPPAGYPKLSLSTKTVTPVLAHTGNAPLCYTITIRNTGAYTATGALLTDPLPEGTTYNNDGWSSVTPAPIVAGGVLTWQGNVGFDSSVVITFSVTVSAGLTGTVRNTAVISQPLIAQPVMVTAETVVTDDPILVITKSSEPEKPGPNKLLTYTLAVRNLGQPAVNLPVTVVDRVPPSTTVQSIGDGGHTNGKVVTWNRDLSLDTGEAALFSFSVLVDDVPSGTVIVNAEYEASSDVTGISAGEPYSVTVVNPILLLSKGVWPDPPGSNREMTYTLTLLNVGSLATGLVITDRVPAGVEYERGGSMTGGVVSWTLDNLDTGQSAEFQYTVSISDVMAVGILNADYGACSAEGVCMAGQPLTNVVQGPVFEAVAGVDPIAHKPGGGTGTEVTPTLVIRNVGNGYALDAVADLIFGRISVGFTDLYMEPPVGTLYDTGRACGEKCRSFTWIGNMAPGDAITFTTHEGQSTIGGEEGTHYTATVVITDSLANTTTQPISDTAIGHVTHYANVVPEKSAPPFVGPGQLLTYTIGAYNRALSTDLPPVLTDVVPLSTTFVWASDGGALIPSADRDTVSWTLPLLSPGEGVARSFSVRVASDTVSGTQIVNEEYGTCCYGNVVTDTVAGGAPVTTTVREVGLIDSYKEVTPTLSLPGPAVLLTYSVHIVNSGPVPLSGVTVDDRLPWEHSTYRQDVAATSGRIADDIVSIHWVGDVPAFAEQVFTFTVVVDPDCQGAITNKAIISHPRMIGEVVVEAVAYVTEDPVLRIRKTAAPDPVLQGGELLYALHVANLGQQATGLVITDRIPANTRYVAGSASGGGQLVGDQVQWILVLLEPGGTADVNFRVTVLGGERIVNGAYGVLSDEGAADAGPPVITRVTRTTKGIYLPLIRKRAP